MEYLNKLKEVMVEEGEKCAIIDETFENIEKIFSITFPDDLKEFLLHYGNGSVHALVNINANDEDDYDLGDDDDHDEEVLELVPIISFYYMNDLKEYEEIINQTIKIFKENDRIDNSMKVFPWGYSDTGGRLFFKINSDGSYGIIIYDRGDDDLFEYDIPITEYLYKIITNEIHFELLSDKNLFNGKGYFM